MNICYFGNFDPNFSRNRIYIKGLRQNGHIVNLVVSHARFPWNIILLVKNYSAVKSRTQIMIVGYGSFLMVPLAKFIAGVPVIYDALCPLIDPAIYSRSLHQKSILHLWRARFFDWLTFNLSDLVLLESKAQKKFVSKTYSVNPNKLAVVYTGADDELFFLKKKNHSNTLKVVFRGKFLPEAGVEHILQAAKMLEKENIEFVIIGNGFELKNIRALYNQLQLTKVSLITDNLTHKELHQYLIEADIMLGQFADNDRLNRTIPHKAYEAMAMGIAYLTCDSLANREIFIQGKTAHLIPRASSVELAKAIQQLTIDADYRKRLASNIRQLFLNRFTPYLLAKDIIQIAHRFSNTTR